MRQVNGAMKSAREMEGSVSVSAYAGHNRGKRGSHVDLLLLPSSRPHSRHEYATRHGRSRTTPSRSPTKQSRSLLCRVDKKAETRAPGTERLSGPETAVGELARVRWSSA